MKLLFRFLAILFLAVWPASSGASNATPPADSVAETLPVYFYMVDVTNTMAGCPRCFNMKSDNVIGSVMDRIEEEVRLSPKPLEVFVVPFSRGVIDLDKDGPFEPWRSFIIRTDEDARRFAEYLDPEKWGHKDSGDEKKLLPKYGVADDQKPWPGFAKVCAGRDSFTTALYDSIIEGLDFLRNRLPKEPDERWRYVSTHLHRMVVFSDSANSVKSAIFPHITQGTDLHKSEMDGRFYLTKVYVEGKTPDNNVDDEIRKEREIAKTAENVFIRYWKELPDVSEMVAVSPLFIDLNENLDDPMKFSSGRLNLRISNLTIKGEGEKIVSSVESSSLMPWPDGVTFVASDKESGPPFENAAEILSPVLDGIKTMIQSNTTSALTKYRLKVSGQSADPAPLFIATEAPVIDLYLRLNMIPPTGNVAVEVIPPDILAGVKMSASAWNLGSVPARKLRAGKGTSGVIELTGDEYVIDPMFQFTFDPAYLQLQDSQGTILASGEGKGLGRYTFKILAVNKPGTIGTELTVSSNKVNIVFPNNQQKYSLAFTYVVTSDWPYYILIIFCVLAAVIGTAVLLRKTVLAPPRISSVGGHLMLVEPGTDVPLEERNLMEHHTPTFKVGSGHDCDWVLTGPMVPYVAFVIELRRREGRLRIYKKDPEIENVKFNGQELVPTFLKDNDRIELLDHAFLFRR